MHTTIAESMYTSPNSIQPGFKCMQTLVERSWFQNWDVEHTDNVRIQNEKYTNHKMGTYHNFMDFKNVRPRLDRCALANNAEARHWGKNVYVIKSLYNKSTVQSWLIIAVGVLQGRNLSPCLFKSSCSRS